MHTSESLRAPCNFKKGTNLYPNSFPRLFYIFLKIRKLFNGRGARMGNDPETAGLSTLIKRIKLFPYQAARIYRNFAVLSFLRSLKGNKCCEQDIRRRHANERKSKQIACSKKIKKKQQWGIRRRNENRNWERRNDERSYGSRSQLQRDERGKG